MKIDLKNLPEPPFNFPHRCFSLSVRIRAALAVLEGPEPWGRLEPKSAPRALAYHQLRELAEEAHYLFRDSDSETAPYKDALAAILGTRKSKIVEIREFDNAGLWTREPLPREEFVHADISFFKQRYLDYTEKLEKLGLYFFHMMQAVNGKNLPEDYEVEVKMPEAGWTPVLPP